MDPVARIGDVLDVSTWEKPLDFGVIVRAAPRADRYSYIRLQIKTGTTGRTCTCVTLCRTILVRPFSCLLGGGATNSFLQFGSS